MLDNEIIKALKCCAMPYTHDIRPRFTLPCGCDSCPLRNDHKYCKNRLAKYVIDLIDRQKAENEKQAAEIERLKGIIESYALQYGTAVDKEFFLKKAKAEALKEFSERLKQMALIIYYDPRKGILPLVSSDIIDNLVKEFTEERAQ